MTTAEFNQRVRAWGSGTKRKLKVKILQQVLNIGPGYNNQQVAVKNYAGEASKINFGFPYYMVFVHKGAGRGYGGSKSGKYTTKSGSKGITNRSSMGKMGTGVRKPKPWFNPVLEAEFPALADLVSTYHGGKVFPRIEKILIR